MKWPQIVMVLLGVLAVAIAVRTRKAEDAAKMAASRPSSPTTAATGGASQSSVADIRLGPSFDIGRPLAASFDQPGVVSRQIGLLRVYFALVPEITLETTAETAARQPDAAPVLVVLENETYQPLPSTTLGWNGTQLGTVRVLRLVEGQRDVEVFQADIPQPTRLDWLSAERRSFTVDWPLRDVSPGTYRVTVQLALPDQPALEILTRVL